MKNKTFITKYQLFRSLPGYRRDNIFLACSFAVTLALSLSLPLILGLQPPPRTGVFLIAATGANIIFWGVCLAVYHLILPAILPYEKLRKRAEEMRTSKLPDA